MRASESIVFDVGDRPPDLITRALGGELIMSGRSEHVQVFTNRIEPIVGGIARRLGDFHVSPVEGGEIDKLSRKEVDRVLGIVRDDPELAAATFRVFADRYSEVWYGRSAIERLYLDFNPGHDAAQRERFLYETGRKKLREFYERLMAKVPALKEWERNRGPSGIRGLGIVPREHHEKHAEHQFLLWDPRQHDKHDYDPTGAKHTLDRVYQWLPPDRRWRPFQHKLDDLLVAVELQ